MRGPPGPDRQAMMASHFDIPGYGARVDAVSSLASWLSREWGEHGYRLSVIGMSDGTAIGSVHHADGSRFWLAVDAYGNRICQSDHWDNLVAEIDHHHSVRSEIL